MKSSESQKDTNNATRVLIVGAGFAGLACAKTLASNKNLKITVIDKNNYHQFQPLLYQVAIGILSTESAAFNLTTPEKTKTCVTTLKKDLHS